MSKKVLASRYELGKRIGNGAMATVYLAQDTVLGRKVAVKILNEDLVSNKKFTARFKQEAQSASALSHPNIVSVLDAGEETTTDEQGVSHTHAYIVMEHIDGLELSKLVARGPLKVAEAIRVTNELLSAVEFAHRAKVIHRDIKPDNIMITRTGAVKVLDFGIARAAADAFDDLAQTTAVLGTAAYFAPEQAQGKRVDSRTDLYAIGVVLFEMLTGRVPFVGDTAVAVAHQHIHAQPPVPSEFNAKVTPALDAVVLKALAKDPKERFQSPQAFTTALADAEAGTVIAVPAAPVVVEELRGPISEPALENTGSVDLPEDLVFLFGDDPQTAPTLIQPETKKMEPKRAVAIVGIIALIFGAIAGMGVWVATLKPTNLFPSSTITIPELKNLSYTEASKQLTDLGLIPTKVTEASALIKTGKVIRTEPAKNTVIDPGTLVQVYVSLGRVKGPVPDVTALPLEEAKTTLTDAEFLVGTVTESTNPSIANGYVISTDPTADSEQYPGTKINIVVSNGKIDIPDVRGMTLPEATSALVNLKLNPVVQADQGCARGTDLVVQYQSVRPGLADQGVAITISYCAGE